MMTEPMRIAILIVSDRCARGVMIDTAGPALAERARERLGAVIVHTGCVSDDAEAIAGRLRAWSSENPPADLILTAGGTGLGSRDVTPEATASVLDRRHPGLQELARLRCLERTPRAFLSRGEAGTLGRSLVINLPGSERGATEFLDALLDVLPHAVAMLRDEPSDHVAPPSAVSVRSMS